MPEYRLRPLAVAGYLLGAMLIIVPLMELAMGTWPPRPSQVSWRFGVVGLFANGLLLPTMGAALLVAVAAAVGHRRTLRSLAAVALLACVAEIALLLLFTLDVVQMRSMVQSQVKLGFDLASAKSVVTLLFGAGVLAAVGISGWRSAGRHRRSEARPPAAAEAGLMIRRPHLETRESRSGSGDRESQDLPAQRGAGSTEENLIRG